ncbi:hypothetical protein GCM10028784_06860 [Myceligenerans cantabricum]
MRDTLQALGCAETRAAMQEYLKHQPLPCRRRRIEDHLIGCAGCIRTFVELREAHWMAGAASRSGLAAA